MKCLNVITRISNMTLNIDINIAELDLSELLPGDYIC
jgi:hypothetical protein